MRLDWLACTKILHFISHYQINFVVGIVKNIIRSLFIKITPIAFNSAWLEFVWNNVEGSFVENVQVWRLARWAMPCPADSGIPRRHVCRVRMAREQAVFPTDPAINHIHQQIYAPNRYKFVSISIYLWLFILYRSCLFKLWRILLAILIN